MKTYFLIFSVISLVLTSCKDTNTGNTAVSEEIDSIVFQSGYTMVNGLKMYYEIYGEGEPMVLIHGGGSDIQTTFGRVIPLLAQHYKLIAVDLQAHGLTGDRDSDLTFEQDADDVSALLVNLGIPRAHIFGFSNGGTTAIQMAIRHPEQVNKIIAASPLCKRDGVPFMFWEFMRFGTLADMPKQLKESYLQLTNDSSGLQRMFDKDSKRMNDFKDIPDESIKAIKAPTLIIIGDRDIITPEHAKELNRFIQGSELFIFPGEHGKYIREITTIKPDDIKTEFAVIPQIEEFLEKGK